MANKIILKKSSVASKVPLATDLDVGEIAVNLADQKLYSKNAGGTVILVGTGTATGTVTSVGMTVPTGLTVSGTPITTSGTLAVTLTAGYSIPTTASQTNWDSAYTQRLQWDGGSTNLVAATGRTSLGGTTVGQNFFTLTNPTAITFPRINADNTVSALDSATFRTAIGAGTGSGTVTGVTATSPVASSGGTAPVISLASGYGDTQNPFASKTANYVLAAPNGSAGVPTFRALAAADIPDLTLEKIPDAWVKKSVRVATTSNITLSGTQTIDGIAVVAGDRVLVKDQTTQSQNGIYVVAAGAWARSTDTDTISELAGSCVNVDSGTTNGGFRFDTDLKTTDTLGTTAVLFYRIYDANDSATANTANKLVLRDASGNFSAGTITATLSGSASTLTTTRTLWGQNFNGSANVTGALSSVTTMSMSGQLTSTLATGTSPFSVTSTTINTNLNADLLDGQHGSYYAPIASPTLTGTPAAPTAAVGTNTTQLATTAFVNAEISNDAFLKAAGGSIVETVATISANYTLTTGSNGLSAGPISINSGVTVTIPSGQTWAIV